MKSVSLSHIDFSYQEDAPPVLKDISLEIGEGEVVLLLGPTGSGKSALLQVIAAVAPHVTGGEISGTASVVGCDILHNPASCRGLVCLVLQEPETQLVNLTVEDEVAFGPENLLLQTDEIHRRVDWAINQCRLGPHKRAFVYTLSGGQKQRLAIASVLAMSPQVFLLDAPLTNLDPMGASEVLSTIVHLCETGATKTVVIASNKIDQMLPLATRIIVMDRGQIVLDGDPEYVLYEKRDLLKDLGLFVPEVSQIWPVVRLIHSNSKLPRTPYDLAIKLQAGNPQYSDTIRTVVTVGDADPVMQADNVRFSYGNHPVLEGITFEIRKGEFVAIAGQNGSGKSTLSGIMCGLRLPKSGRMVVLGGDTKTVSPQGQVGYVFQYPEHQFITATIGGELRYGLTENLTAEELDSRVNDILSQIGMTGREEDSPYDLSVGEKRMLSVATMLMFRPRILILDEPTTGLDRRLTENLMRILRRFVTDYGMTVIQVSHDMEQIAEHCNRVLVIENGYLIFDGPPRNLFADTGVMKSAKIQPPPIAQVAQYLFPGCDSIAITVGEFLKEVGYAYA